MSKQYFSYDPDNGIEFHDDAESARESAAESLSDAAHAAQDTGWDDSEGNICWGEVLGRVETTERPLAENERGPDWLEGDIIRAAELVSYDGAQDHDDPKDHRDKIIVAIRHMRKGPAGFSEVLYHAREWRDDAQGANAAMGHLGRWLMNKCAPDHIGMDGEKWALGEIINAVEMARNLVADGQEPKAFEYAMEQIHQLATDALSNDQSEGSAPRKAPKAERTIK